MIPLHYFNQRILSGFLHFLFLFPSYLSLTTPPPSRLSIMPTSSPTPRRCCARQGVSSSSTSLSAAASAAAVVAPAGGTAREVKYLSRELGLPDEVVSEVMNSGWRGYNRRTSADSAVESRNGVGGGGVWIWPQWLERALGTIS